MKSICYTYCVCGKCYDLPCFFLAFKKGGDAQSMCMFWTGENLDHVISFLNGESGRNISVSGGDLSFSIYNRKSSDFSSRITIKKGSLIVLSPGRNETRPGHWGGINPDSGTFTLTMDEFRESYEKREMQISPSAVYRAVKKSSNETFDFMVWHSGLDFNLLDFTGSQMYFHHIMHIARKGEPHKSVISGSVIIESTGGYFKAISKEEFNENYTDMGEIGRISYMGCQYKSRYLYPHYSKTDDFKALLENVDKDLLGIHDVWGVIER